MAALPPVPTRRVLIVGGKGSGKSAVIGHLSRQPPPNGAINTTAPFLGNRLHIPVQFEECLPLEEKDEAPLRALAERLQTGPISMVVYVLPFTNRLTSVLVAEIAAVARIVGTLGFGSKLVLCVTFADSVDAAQSAREKFIPTVLRIISNSDYPSVPSALVISPALLQHPVCRRHIFDELVAIGKEFLHVEPEDRLTVFKRSSSSAWLAELPPAKRRRLLQPRSRSVS